MTNLKANQFPHRLRTRIVHRSIETEQIPDPELMPSAPPEPDLPSPFPPDQPTVPGRPEPPTGPQPTPPGPVPEPPFPKPPDPLPVPVIRAHYREAV
jgi:hypothetical protein